MNYSSPRPSFIERAGNTQAGGGAIVTEDTHLAGCIAFAVPA